MQQPPSWLKIRIDLARTLVCSRCAYACFVVCFSHQYMMMMMYVINCRSPCPKGPVLSSAAMSAKAISEQTGKDFLYKYICTTAAVQNRFRYASVTAETDWGRLTQEHPWLLTEVRLLRRAQHKSFVLACLGFRLSPELVEGYWNHEANYMLYVTETLDIMSLWSQWHVTVHLDAIKECTCGNV